MQMRQQKTMSHTAYASFAQHAAPRHARTDGHAPRSCNRSSRHTSPSSPAPRRKTLYLRRGIFVSAASRGPWPRRSAGTFGQRRDFFRAMCLGMAGAGLSMIIRGIPDTLLPFCHHAVHWCALLLRHHPAINAVLANNTPPSYKGATPACVFAAQQVGSM